MGECFDCLIPQASPWGSGIFHQHRLSQNIASDGGGGGGQQRRSGDGGSLTWNLLFVLLTGYTCACLTASLCRDGMPFSRFHKDRKQKFLLLWFCVCSWTNMWTWEANLLSLPWVPDPSCCSDSMGLRDLVPKMGLFPPAMPQKSL